MTYYDRVTSGSGKRELKREGKRLSSTEREREGWWQSVRMFSEFEYFEEEEEDKGVGVRSNFHLRFLHLIWLVVIVVVVVVYR